MSSVAALKIKNRVFTRPIETIKDGSIEAGLLSLRAWQLEHPGVPLSLSDMAHVCGCHKNLIFEIEKRALKKMRKFKIEALR